MDDLYCYNMKELVKNTEVVWCCFWLIMKM